MYRYVVDFHIYWILLDIALPPPQPEATLSTTNVTEGGRMMKIISINEEDKRSNIKYKGLSTLTMLLETGLASIRIK